MDLAAIFSQSFTTEPIVFTETKTKVRGLRVEYFIGKDCVKFHIWPEPKFPELLSVALRLVFRDFDKVIEYIPEVSSWYVEVKNLRMGVMPSFVEGWIKKLGDQLG